MDSPAPQSGPGDTATPRGRLPAARRARPHGPVAELAAIVDSSAEAIFRQDVTGALTVWNRAAQRLLGRPEGRMRGAELAESLVTEDTEKWADLLRDIAAGERLEDVPLRFHRSDDQTIHVSVTAIPTWDSEGSADGAWVVVRDLTEQFLTQRTLAAGEERVRRSEVLAATGSFVVDRAAKAVQWSPGMYAIFGVTPLDFEPSVDAHITLVHPDDQPVVRDLFEAALAGALVSEVDHRVRRPDGTTGWVFLAVEPARDFGGQLVGMSGVCQDVTQRKEAEAAVSAALDRERAAAEELRRVDAVKEEFLATVSHELRTPLTAILGFSSLLRSVAHEYDDLLEPIERNGKDMHQMVERLLDYSRLEAGRVRINMVTVPLAEHVRRCSRVLQTQLAARPFIIDIDEALEVWVDPDALDRILVNLIGNAVKYSAPPSAVTVSGALDGNGVVVSVSDEGPGIALEHQEHLFDRFYRAPEQTANTLGTGVGLAIVRQYVELHGGRVWVDSVPGAGATFRFVLPNPGLVSEASEPRTS